MIVGDSLRFLAERVEDEQEFIFKDVVRYRFINGELHNYNDEDKRWFLSSHSLSHFLSKAAEFKVAKLYNFTADEKAILRSIPSEYCFIARDGNNMIFVFTERPTKDDRVFRGITYRSLDLYEHLFQSVTWEDDEACEFREYV